MRSARRALAALLTVVAVVGVAIWIFGDRDIPPEVLAERYTNAASRFVTLPSGTVAHVRDQGRSDGEPLVLVHGSTASLHTWEPWVAILGDEFRLVSFDLPGHGLTGRTVGDDYSIDAMVAFVDQVTRSLGVDRFHLAGSSMGGRAAWHFALDHPERVRRLILISASGYPEPDDEDPPLGFLLARLPLVNRLMLYVTPRAVVAETLRAAFAEPSLATEEMATRYHELLLREGSREAMRARLTLPVYSERIREIGRIRQPTLVIWGREDALVPVADAERFARDLPDVRVRIYDGVGHLPMEEAPEPTAAAVRAFLRGEL